MGFEPQKFSPRLLHNTGYSFSEQKLNASKGQALLWFKQSKAFDKVDPNKSYAQALCLNSNLDKSDHYWAVRNLGILFDQSCSQLMITSQMGVGMHLLLVWISL